MELGRPLCSSSSSTPPVPPPEAAEAATVPPAPPEVEAQKLPEETAEVHAVRDSLMFEIKAGFLFNIFNVR